MKDYIEERAIGIAKYIIENNATVRQTARQFGISKSTVHVVVTKWNGWEVRLCGWLNRWKMWALSGGNLRVLSISQHKKAGSQHLAIETGY